MKVIRIQRNNKGFTLAEFLVSMIVIAIAFLAFAVFLSVSKSTVINREFRTKGIEYLEEEIELLEGLGYKTLVKSFFDGVQYGANTGLPSGYSRWFTVCHNSPIAGMARLKVEISWKENDKTKVLKLETYITSGLVE